MTQLENKVNIINNTIPVAKACGVENPKVAPLAAVEVVNPKMPCTVEAAELVKMNEEGKLCGDCDYAAVEPIVDAITPVPGGVGSVTTSVLVGHVVEAAMRKYA